MYNTTSDDINWISCRYRPGARVRQHERRSAGEERLFQDSSVDVVPGCSQEKVHRTRNVLQTIDDEVVLVRARCRTTFQFGYIGLPKLLQELAKRTGFRYWLGDVLL